MVAVTVPTPRPGAPDRSHLARELRQRSRQRPGAVAYSRSSRTHRARSGLAQPTAASHRAGNV